MSQKPLIARQAILNKLQNLYGYELLFRDDAVNFSNIQNTQSKESYQATVSTLIEFFTNLFTEGFVANARLFINFTKQHLIDDLSFMLSNNKIVVEILEGFELDDAMINTIDKLKQAGYTIALDDYEFSPVTDKIIPYCDLIKFDIEGKYYSQIDAFVEKSKRYQIQLLAERVETQEDFTLCKALGFDYFQGYFFAKPNIIKGKKIALNQFNIIELANALSQEDVEIDEINRLIAQEPELVFRILAMANSLEYRGVQKIVSLKAAIIRFGLIKLKSWVLLFLSKQKFDKPSDLIKNSLVRAKFFENLSPTLPDFDKDALYLFSILSHIDGLMDHPIADLVDKLNTNETISDALIQRTGKLFELLNAVEQLEQGYFSKVFIEGLTLDYICEAYMKSITSMSNTIKE